MSSPSYTDWIPMGNFLATSASYISSMWSSNGPEQSLSLSGLEKSVDPFAFIICIALRKFLGNGYKPALSHYHITWDPPTELVVAKALKIPQQGYDRGQKGENASRKIIDEWDAFTEDALNWFEPSMVLKDETLLAPDQECSFYLSLLNPTAKPDMLLTEGHVRQMLLEVEKRRQMRIEMKKRYQITEIFTLAISGFEETKEPYLSEQEMPCTKQLIRKLDSCKKKIETALGRVALNNPDLYKDKASPLDEKLKRVWDTATIDYIYSHFQELEKLAAKKRTPFEQKFFEDTIRNVQAKVTSKCTEFAMTHYNARLWNQRQDLQSPESDIS